MNQTHTTQRTPTTVLIQGDTYRVKEELKALGGVWDPVAKGWRVPTEYAAEARNIVENCEGQMGFVDWGDYAEGE